MKIPNQVKCVCPVAGCTAAGYFSPAQVRDDRLLACPDHGELVIPERLELASALCPGRVEEHPDWEGWGKDEQGAPAWSGEGCSNCGRPRAAHLDRDEWYCRPPYGCGHVNERHADGTLGNYRPESPFGPDVERCNGLAKLTGIRPGSGWTGKVAAKVTGEPVLPF
jgi:hypothetical protein